MKFIQHRVRKLEILESRWLLAGDTIHPAEQVLESPIDGIGNNLENPEWGAADTQLIRIVDPAYDDGMASPAGPDRPNPRYISNMVVAQSDMMPNSRELTDMVWLWGQFIDHDIDLTTAHDPVESLPIQVPMGDEHFDPMHSGEMEIGFDRSVFDADTGDNAANPRQQLNKITSFLDGSVVYGSSNERASALRSFEQGQLKVSDGNLLPFNEPGFDNAGGRSSELFLAGDVRANENAALSAMHTIWVREHNYWATDIAHTFPEWSDQQIYVGARGIVTAELQAITFNQFLPVLLGENAIVPYTGYDSSIHAGISNLFSTAAYRFGHSMLSPELQRLNSDRTVAEEGPLPLRNAFFSPQQLMDHGVDSLLIGATTQLSQEVDTKLIDDVRNFLFGPPGAGGFDLASLNIQRGRDHGLATYNQVRADLGLPIAEHFADISSDPQIQQALQTAYGDIDKVDVWLGGLAEDHVPGASVGQLNQTLLADQFTRMRDGDRFWYQNVFEGAALAQLDQTMLSEVILRNSSISTLPTDLFVKQSMMFVDESLETGSSIASDMGDLDGDGDLDAIVTSGGETGNRILFNNHGRFVDSGQSLGVNLAHSCAIFGDVDGDNDLDVISVTEQGTHIWLNDGEGQFTDSGQAISNRAAVDIAIGDVDNDADLDLFLAFGENAPNEVWLNNGSALFRDSNQRLGTASSFEVSLGDVDGDGDLDGFVANRGEGESHQSRIWFNDGTGRFIASGENMGMISSQIALGDLDGDDDLDAFVLNTKDDNGPDRVLFNDGSGVFVDSGQLLGDRPGAHAALGDLDLDGDLDVFVANGDGFPSMIWLNDGSGTFQDAGHRLNHGDGSFVSLGDVDNDGDLDALVTNRDGNNLIWHNVSRLQIGDFDGNGIVHAADMDLLCQAIRSGDQNNTFDLDANGHLDLDDMDFMVGEVLSTSYGDSNLDGAFDSGDLIHIFQKGKYETGEKAGWAAGDWNCDGVFTTKDIIHAFQLGMYESVAAMPIEQANMIPPVTIQDIAAAFQELETDRRSSRR